MSQDFSFAYDKVHYSMLRKYLKQTLKIRVGATKLDAYNVCKFCTGCGGKNRKLPPRLWMGMP